VHNHPYRVATQSDADAVIATWLKLELNQAGVKVIDHMIAGERSFVEMGLH
jgi:DNA repair protein RadC